MTNKKLQILITQYNETDDVIKPMLDSISFQQKINFDDLEVIIYNDGSKVRLSRKLLKSYPYKIHYYVGEVNKGVALARQILYKLSSAPYIMYCDADDSFYTVFSLLDIFKEIEKGFDVLITDFYEEVVDPNGYEILVKHTCDKVFIHGKVFRRSFLECENIHWVNICPSEDNYYVKLSLSLSSDTKYIELPLYLWKWRGDSIVRKDKEKWQLKNFPRGVESEMLLIEELKKRKKDGNANYFIALEMYSIYFSLNRDIWRDKTNHPFLLDALLTARDFYKRYKDIWKEIPLEDKLSIFEANVGKQKARGFIDDVDIEEWIKRTLE